MSKELKPCPFCGAPAAFSKRANGVTAYCTRYSCGANIASVKKEATKQAWNRRAEPLPIPEPEVNP
jgi:hypothetical protein